MASQFETGHAVNVANFLKYKQFLETLGTGYNPSLDAIKLTAFDALYTDAQAKLDDVTTVLDVWKTETNRREMIFEKLNTVSTRLVGMLRGVNAPKPTLDDLAALVAKVRGKARSTSATKPQAGGDPTPAEPAPTRSSSQTSFDQRIANFSKMVVLVKGVQAYAPTEPDMSVQGLETLYAELVTINTLASKADAELRMARAKRDAVLYTPETGLLDLVKVSKGYIQGAFGRTSAEFKMASAYKFAKRDA